MLGSGVLPARLGGAYALQRLAQEESDQYHVQIMELFCSFVRERSKEINNEGGKVQTLSHQEIMIRVRGAMIPEDVQVVMTAIGKRSAADIRLEQKEGFRPDLSGAQLRCVNLANANLSGIDLYDAVFAPPDLDDTIREGIERVLSRYRGANLTGIDLTDANLSKTDLSNANLAEARLTRTNLADSNLTGPRLFITQT